MPERWTDIIAAVAAAAGVAYMIWEIGRRQRELQDLCYVLTGEDAHLTLQLEHLVRTGALRPVAVGTA